MKILLLGKTAGAHYLAQLLAEDENVSTVYHYSKVNSYDEKQVILSDSTNAIEFLETHQIDLVIPLINVFQLWDSLRVICAGKNIPVLMPLDAEGPMLEWSKIKGKIFLTKAGIPTANLIRIISKTDLVQHFQKFPRPFVLKYEQDWRAGQQTVIITDDNAEYQLEHIQEKGSVRYMAKDFGDFNNQHFITEEFVEGVREYSYHVLINSKSRCYLGSARDYKKRNENDSGDNTASMGSYGIVEDVDPIIDSYVDKFVEQLYKNGIAYTGVLYLGIMETVYGVPLVLEINTRFGDPELCAILPLINGSVAKLLLDCAVQNNMEPISFKNKKSVAVRIVNKNYSLDNDLTKMKFPNFSDAPKNICVSYNVLDQELLFGILTVVDDTIEKASDIIYSYLKTKDLGDYTYRTDIGYLK